MYRPLKMFGVREWATHRNEGHVCPTCTLGRLELRPPLAPGELAHLRCSRCLRTYPPGWFRHHYDIAAPREIAGQTIGDGPLFATIQHWTRIPDGTPQLQLADFYLDIDRGNFDAAIRAAEKYRDLFDHYHVAYRMGFSGKKGFWFQIPWQVVGAHPLPNLHEGVYRTMALEMQEHTREALDMKLYSQARMFREPLTRHADTGLFKIGLDPRVPLTDVRIRAADRGNHYAGTLDLTVNPFLHRAFLVALPKSYEEPLAPAAPAFAELQPNDHVPCVQRALEEGPPSPGTRNQLNMNLAAYYNGRDGEELVHWARTVAGASKTPANERVVEMRSTLRWAQRSNATFSCHSMQSLGLCDPRCGFYPLSTSFAEVPDHAPTAPVVDRAAQLAR